MYTVQGMVLIPISLLHNHIELTPDVSCFNLILHMQTITIKNSMLADNIIIIF